MLYSFSITRAVALQWVGAAFCGAISVALMAWLARMLQPTEFAMFGAALNAALIALVVIEGGWSSLLYRELAGGALNPRAMQLPAAALTHTMLALGPCAMALVVILPSSLVAISAALCMFVVALMNQYSARLRAAGEFGHEALWQVVGRVCSAIAIVVALTLFAGTVSDFLRPAALVFLAWLIGLTFCLLLAAQRWWRTPNWQAAKSMYPMAVALLMTELSVTVIGKGDLVLLSLASSLDIATGMALSLDAMPGYAVSVRLVEGVLLLVAPLANVVISYLRESDANQFAAARQRVLGSAFALWSLGCVLWAAGWAGGNVIIPFVFGADYAGSERWLVWASLPLPWMMANLVLLQAAFARTELRLIVGRVGFCAVFFLIACFILMRLIGASGVGLGAALSQALLSAFLFECILGARKRRAGAQS